MIFCMPFLSIARVIILGTYTLYEMLNSKHHNKLLGLITKAIEINTQERDRDIDIDREKCIYVNTETEREGGKRETETEREKIRLYASVIIIYKDSNNSS